MSARRCFSNKIRSGRVGPRAGQQILDMLDGFEREHQARLGDGAAARQAALDAAEAAAIAAARKADLARGQLIAQADVLRAAGVTRAALDTLRAEGKAPLFLKNPEKSALFTAVRSLLARDPHEMTPTWNNVHYLARDIRGRAHAKFAAIIEELRPKGLGFKSETIKELDLLRALYGDPRAPAELRPLVQGWNELAEDLRQQYVKALGLLPERKDWRLPNPTLDVAKVRAAGADRFKAFVRDRVDRAAMLDFETGKPLSDARFEILLDEATSGFITGFADGPPTAAFRGRRMLANQRDFARFFVWKDAEAWTQVAEGFGLHASVFETMVGHIAGMADDIALMRIMGPNPEGTKRFILSLFDREAGQMALSAGEDAGKGALAKAVKGNRRIEASLRTQKRRFESLWDEVTGASRIPVNPELARLMGNARSALVASQMGSAIVSSITDPAIAMAVAHSNGLSPGGFIARATSMMMEKGSEIRAAQMGLVADTLAHTLGEADRVMGETIRTGVVAKLGPAVIRLQGLRRWTAVLRAAFGLESMAEAARNVGIAFADLDPRFRQSLQRYGIDAGEWDRLRATELYEPETNAFLLRPMDVADRTLGEKWARYINTEMDYAVIDYDPETRAILLGQSRPGTLGGEVRRSATMYRSFPATFMAMHFARAFARGWDGKRLSHAAIVFLAATAMGAVAMQAKAILSGKDPYDLDPSSSIGLRNWGRAVIQGGGLGVFGDLLFMDRTRYGNTWAATGAGALFTAGEAILGDFGLKNIQRWANGEETHFAGDALYLFSRYLPGSSLWFSRLVFQRAIVDQAALLVDPRAPERMRRMERTAMKNWGQDYWWQLGQPLPGRGPDLSAMIGGSQ